MTHWFDVALLEREACGDQLFVARFERPAGYVFQAGQYFSLRLRTAEGEQAKQFSHAEALGDGYMELATRPGAVPSPFKLSLLALEAGDRVSVSSAAGRLVLPEDPGPVVFLVGGIGITPVRSIVRDAVQRETGLDAVLFFGNASETCVPYRDELDGYAAAGIRTVHVFEHPSEGWRGPTGFITAGLVRENAEGGHAGVSKALFVTAGPPAMVAAMQRCMDELDVPEERRLVERFTGY